MIRIEAWSDKAEAMLLKASSVAVLPIIRSEVQRGVSQLWHGQDDFADCYLVLRMEAAPLECCCVAAAGRGVSHYARMLIDECKRRGISMRCHVEGDATERLWGRLGFKREEVVMRIKA